MLYKFNEYIKESQVKKLQKYFTFSVVLEWYRKNKEKIAAILGCKVEDLATEDVLMTQSYYLVNDVINTQSDGNEGRGNTKGFSKYDKIENNLIHDILHNMYNVQTKNFGKSLNDLQFSESELFEEIEVLGIEESFMKNMNIKYPKTDFINQNINLLVSYLMVTIMKNDPDRISKILKEEEDFYLEIYGKKYYIKDTPYENLLYLLENGSDADNYYDGRDFDTFKKYCIHLLNVINGISNSSGDRAQYPDGEYYGDMSFGELSVDRIKNYLDYSDDYMYITNNQSDVDDLLEILTDGSDGNYDNVIKDHPSQLKLFKLDDVEDKRQSQRTINQKIYLTLKNLDILDYVKDDDIDLESWFSHVEETYPDVDVDVYGTDEDDDKEKFIVISLESGEVATSNDYAESYYEGERETYDRNHDFINKSEYKDMELSILLGKILRDDDGIAIMRRNFRTNGVVKNNRKLGKDNPRYSYYGGKKSNPHAIVDFYDENQYDTNYSVSKNILTDNGKRLNVLLNDLKGYVVKNSQSIKDNYKDKTNKFKDYIELYKNINLFKMDRVYNFVKETKSNTLIDCKLVLNQYRYSTISASIENEFIFYYENYDKLVKLLSYMESTENLEFLMNSLNLRGGIVKPLDVNKFKEIMNKFVKIKTKFDKLYNFIKKLNEMKDTGIDIFKKIKNDRKYNEKYVIMIETKMKELYGIDLKIVEKGYLFYDIGVDCKIIYK